MRGSERARLRRRATEGEDARPTAATETEHHLARAAEKERAPPRARRGRREKRETAPRRLDFGKQGKENLLPHFLIRILGFVLGIWGFFFILIEFDGLVMFWNGFR